MGKTAIWRLAILLALITAAFLLVNAGFFAAQSPTPAPPSPKPAAAPAAPPAGESPSPAATGRQSGQIKMAQKPPTFTPAPPAADYSYSLKKPNNERTILPGVTISPGQGVNIKTANKDENIQIKRDSTYPASDYQVMWQKRY